MWGCRPGLNLFFGSCIYAPFKSLNFLLSTRFLTGPLCHVKACCPVSRLCVTTQVAPTACQALHIYPLMNAHISTIYEIKRKFREVNQLAKGHPVSAAVFIHCAALPQLAGGSLSPLISCQPLCLKPVLPSGLLEPCSPRTEKHPRTINTEDDTKL